MYEGKRGIILLHNVQFILHAEVVTHNSSVIEEVQFCFTNEHTVHNREQRSFTNTWVVHLCLCLTGCDKKQMSKKIVLSCRC